jgi:hypothetical protein
MAGSRDVVSSECLMITDEQLRYHSPTHGKRLNQEFWVLAALLTNLQ